MVWKQEVALSRYTFSRLDWISQTVAPYSFLKLWNVFDCVKILCVHLHKCIYAYWITYHLWFMFSTLAARDSVHLKILAGEMKLMVTFGLLLLLAGPSWQELARWQDLEDNSRPREIFLLSIFHQADIYRNPLLHSATDREVVLRQEDGSYKWVFSFEALMKLL